MFVRGQNMKVPLKFCLTTYWLAVAASTLVLLRQALLKKTLTPVNGGVSRTPKVHNLIGIGVHILVPGI